VSGVDINGLCSYQDPRLNGRGVPKASCGDGKGNREDLLRANIFKENMRLGFIDGLKKIRLISAFAAYGSAVSGQVECVAFFTGARLISDYLITILGGQDNEAIYRHIFIDLATFYYPNPVYFPVGLFMRIYLKGEGDKNALSK